MTNIVITGNEEITHRIKELLKNIVNLNTDTFSKDINFEKVLWVTPLSILPLAANITKKMNENPKLNIIYPAPSGRYFESYLKSIKFPKGLDQYLFNQDSTYIPILHLNLQNKEQKNVAEIAINKYVSFLKNILKDQDFKENIENAIGYVIHEIIDNVFHHSTSQSFWILAQYWKSKKQIEICLLDEGNGFKKAYQNAETPINPKDDIEAIKYALNSTSSKQSYIDSERRYGIRTSLKLITESELNG
ncbi:MAG: hypothetical protein BWK75_06625 [Candidatus Altiarchaeales archaeon A3]|nr:MAG: hypothetical protein BWK75_06625 [Candidatus Altiarchaeales archaeon A3]